MSLECGSGHAIQVRTLLPNSVLPAPAPLTTVLSTKGPRRQRPADYWPARSTMWTSRQFSRSQAELLQVSRANPLQRFVLPDIGITFVFNLCNYAISSSRESRVFHLFATMPFLHFAKARFSIFATMPFLHFAKTSFPSSQLCLFFISRRQVFHLRNYVFSSFREIMFSSKTALAIYNEPLPKTRIKGPKPQKGETRGG